MSNEKIYKYLLLHAEKKGGKNVFKAYGFPNKKLVCKAWDSLEQKGLNPFMIRRVKQKGNKNVK
jgi:hypothetical protein